MFSKYIMTFISNFPLEQKLNEFSMNFCKIIFINNKGFSSVLVNRIWIKYIFKEFMQSANI